MTPFTGKGSSIDEFYFHSVQSIPITEIKYSNHTINLLRLDLQNDEIGGNKYFKLKYNLQQAKKSDYETLLTFGGAYSNHIYAVAAAGEKYSIKTIGIIRGENVSNATLDFARKNNMRLHFISRDEYRNTTSPEFIHQLKKLFGDFYLIPEGGTNLLAVKGCSEILNGLENNYDFIFCAAGTGGTLAGSISTPHIQSQVIGISVLKGDDYLTKTISGLLKEHLGFIPSNWEVNNKYHLGGYAKYNQHLINFIREFYHQHKIMLDPIYTGKVMVAVYDLIDKNYFASNSNILAIHSGGLQGINGWEAKYGKLFS